MNYHDQKILQTPTCDIQNTEQLFQPYWVSSAVHSVISMTGDQTNNHRMQKPKLYHWVEYIYIYIYIYGYYSVQLTQNWEEFHQDKKTFNSEHLNFPGKELNVTDITEH